MKNLKSILKVEKNFLIDRGDLSKEIELKYTTSPKKNSKTSKFKENIYIATNF